MNCLNRYFFIVSSSWSSHSQIARSTNILRQHENKPLLKVDMATKARRVLLRARTYNFTLAVIISICAFCALISMPAYIYPTVREHIFYNSSSTGSSSSATTTSSSSSSSSILMMMANNRSLSSLMPVSAPMSSMQSTTSVVYVYQVQASDLDLATGGLIFRITFYMWAIVGKLIPCALLFVFSSLLVRSLVQIGRKSHVS